MFRICVTRNQADAVVAALQLLAASLENETVTPNDGDIGTVLTCDGQHAGLTADEVRDISEALLCAPEAATRTTGDENG